MGQGRSGLGIWLAGCSAALTLGVWAASLPAQSTPERTDEQLWALAHRAATARRLAQPSEVCVRRVAPHQLVRLARERLERLYSPDDILNEAYTLELLGLIDEPELYRRRVVQSLGQSMAGYYDISRRCLFLAADLDFFENQRVLAHELAHALQDHHFDLSRLLDHPPGRSDELHAAAALVEGDATAVAAAITRRWPWPEVFRRLPALVRRNLAGPFPPVVSPSGLGSSCASTGSCRPPGGAAGVESYLRQLWSSLYGRGVELVGRVHRRRGWQGVNQLFRSPPRTTADLYPSRGASPRPAVPASVELVPPGQEDRLGQCQVRYRDRLGPLGLQLALAPWLGDRRAERAVASGWLGDQLLLLEGCSGGMTGQGRVSLLLLSRWAEGPERIEQSLLDALHRRWPRARTVRRGRSVLFRRANDQCSLVARQAHWVVYGERVGCTTAISLVDNVLAAAAVIERGRVGELRPTSPGPR